MAIKFSIIIPCFNEAEHLRSCLESLKAQEYPSKDFEIIFVDNGSSDGSVDIAKQYTDHVFYQPGINVGAVRNFGATQADNDNLVFIDADCTVDKEWLTRASKLLSADQKTIFGGGCQLPKNASWIETFWLLEGTDGNVLPTDLIGCSILITSSLFFEIGGFNTKLKSGEDTEFSQRAKKLGHAVNITRNINVVHHGNAKTLSSFIKRQLWHGKGYDRPYQRHLNDPIFFMTIAFMLLPILLLFSCFLDSIYLAIILIAALALPTTLTAKRYYRAKRKARNVQELFRAFILDFCYLIGRSIGMVCKAIE